MTLHSENETYNTKCHLEFFLPRQYEKWFNKKSEQNTPNPLAMNSTKGQRHESKALQVNDLSNQESLNSKLSTKNNKLFSEHLRFNYS